MGDDLISHEVCSQERRAPFCVSEELYPVGHQVALQPKSTLLHTVPPGRMGEGAERQRGLREAQRAGEAEQRHPEADRVVPPAPVQKAAEEGEALRASVKGWLAQNGRHRY